MVKRANLNEVLKKIEKKTNKTPRYPPLNVTCTNTNKTSGMKSFKSHQSMKWHCRDANLWVVTKRSFLPPSVYSQNKILFPNCLNKPNKLHYFKGAFLLKLFYFSVLILHPCVTKNKCDITTYMLLWMKCKWFITRTNWSSSGTKTLLLFESHRLPPFSPNQWTEKWYRVITATVSVTDLVSSEWHVLPDANLWRVADAERCEASSEAPDWDDYWWNDIISNSRIFTPDVRAVPSMLSSYIFYRKHASEGKKN